jgi:hypothetical protein
LSKEAGSPPITEELVLLSEQGIAGEHLDAGKTTIRSVHDRRGLPLSSLQT